jgi:hypothetical protein
MSTAPLSSALPLLTPGAANGQRPSTADGERHQMWLRTLEQELQSWFQDPSSPQTAQPLPASALALAQPFRGFTPSTGLSFSSSLRGHGPSSPETFSSLSSPVEPPVPGVAEAGAPSSEKTDFAGGETKALPELASLHPLLETLSQAITAEVAEAHTAPSTPAMMPKPSPAPVRLHAEWSEGGLRLWLGMDTNPALLTQIEPLLHDLRRKLEASGIKLLALVCNGQNLWEDPTPNLPQPVEETLP